MGVVTEFQFYYSSINSSTQELPPTWLQYFNSTIVQLIGRENKEKRKKKENFNSTIVQLIAI